jgi:O18-antigen biosynthesis glycosyltransferase
MITVLTPTYNRAYTLERLYQSLSVQSIPFEWLIIDDGSTDTTRELIDSFQKNTLFPIHYMYQANSGKHVAINTGVRHALGDFIFIVDSDDILTEDALFYVQNAIESLGKNDVGICFRRAYFDGNLIGTNKLSAEPLYLSPTEAGNYLQGDLAYIFRTSALLSHPFPAIKGEKFVPELLIWNAIGDEGKIIYYPGKAIYLCEYLEDGYTVNFKRNLRRNPKGFALFYRDQIFREKSLIRKIKCTVRYLQCLYYEIIR